jgi:hypothetical protein
MPMGGTLWRYGTQEEGCTNHSFIHSFIHSCLVRQQLGRGLVQLAWTHFQVRPQQQRVASCYEHVQLRVSAAGSTRATGA